MTCAQAGGFGSKLAMYHRFINPKMKLDNMQEIAKLMALWIGKVKGMHFELEAVVAKVTNEDVILVGCLQYMTNSLLCSTLPDLRALHSRSSLNAFQMRGDRVSMLSRRKWRKSGLESLHLQP